MNTQGTLIPKAVFLYGTMLYNLSCSTFPGPPLIDIYTPLATEPPHDGAVNEVHANVNSEAPLSSSNSGRTGKAKVCLKAFPLTTHSQIDQYFPALCPEELESNHRMPPHTVSPAAVPHEAHRRVRWKSALVFLPSKPSYSHQNANFLVLFNCSGSSRQYSIFPSSFLLKIPVDLSIYIYILARWACREKSFFTFLWSFCSFIKIVISPVCCATLFIIYTCRNLFLCFSLWKMMNLFSGSVIIPLKNDH